MAQKELPLCPVETTLMLISDRWVVLILRDLLTGTKRFGELKKSLAGISQKVLTKKLRDMESNYPSSAPRGIHADGYRGKPQTHFGGDV